MEQQKLFDNIDNDEAEGQDDKSPFVMTIKGKIYDERKKAGDVITNLFKSMNIGDNLNDIGEYAGFRLSLARVAALEGGDTGAVIHIEGSNTYSISGSLLSGIGNISRIQNNVRGLEKSLAEKEYRLSCIKSDLEASKTEYEKPFPKEERLKQLLERQRELVVALSEQDKADTSIEPVEEAGDVCLAQIHSRAV